MKKIFRVLYPAFLYLGIAQISSILFTLVTMPFFLIFNNPGHLPYHSVLYQYMLFQNKCMLVMTFLGAILAIPVLYWFFKRDQIMRGIFPAIKIQLPKCSEYVMLLGIGACIAGNNVIALSGIDRIFDGYDEVANGLYGNALWFQVISVGIVIPIAEEFTFRGLIYARLRDDLGYCGAAILSAVGFGFFHGNVVQGLYACFLGLLMAFVFEKCKSLMAPILFHCVANLTSVAISSTILGNLLYMNGIAVLAATLAALILTLLCYRRIASIKNL